MSHYPVPPANRRNARKMRKALTEPELKLWNEIRAHRLMGTSFRRQMPIAGYIVDFACPQHQIIVEVDGAQHAELATDPVRDRMLQELGWTVLRFWNDDVLRDIDGVCSHIVAFAGLTQADADRQVAGASFAYEEHHP
ncbi:MAG: endonuclease domain-containing protein [Rhizobiaceae bacterium]|nr:endonuclease domain-containing protein [Rhizobiaceae bacterium]